MAHSSGGSQERLVPIQQRCRPREMAGAWTASTPVCVCVSGGGLSFNMTRTQQEATAHQAKMGKA